MTGFKSRGFLMLSRLCTLKMFFFGIKRGKTEFGFVVTARSMSVSRCIVCGFFPVRKRKINTLKSAYFVSHVVSLFVGFPRHKRVVDGYAPCLLCKVDICIAGRGLGNLWGHWKGAELLRLAQNFRIVTQCPLLEKSYRPVSADEYRRIRLQQMVESLIYLDTRLRLTVAELVAIDEPAAAAAAAAANKPQLYEDSACYLWLTQMVSASAAVTDVRGVLRLVDMCSVAMRS